MVHDRPTKVNLTPVAGTVGGCIAQFIRPPGMAAAPESRQKDEGSRSPSQTLGEVHPLRWWARPWPGRHQPAGATARARSPARTAAGRADAAPGWPPDTAQSAVLPGGARGSLHQWTWNGISLTSHCPRGFRPRGLRTLSENRDECVTVRAVPAGGGGMHGKIGASVGRPAIM